MSKRVSRLVGQAAIFTAMLLIAVIDIDVLLLVVTVLVAIALPFAWTAAGLLVWASGRAPDIASLSDAADNLLTVAINTTVATVVAVLVVLDSAGIIDQPTGPILTIGLGYVIVTNVLPATRALHTFRDVWLPRIRLRG